MKNIIQLSKKLTEIIDDFRHSAGVGIDTEMEISHYMAEQACEGAKTHEDYILAARNLFILSHEFTKQNYLKYATPPPPPKAEGCDPQ